MGLILALELILKGLVMSVIEYASIFALLWGLGAVCLIMKPWDLE